MIGDDVEVGANSCIDRGTVADTVIGDGTKIDNLVQLGHNVKVGRTCLICGQAGGRRLDGDRRPGGARRQGGGRRPSDDRRERGDHRQFRASPRNVPPNRIMMGYPAVRMDQNVEMYKALRRLPRLLARLEAAQKPVSNPDASD